MVLQNVQTKTAKKCILLVLLITQLYLDARSGKCEIMFTDFNGNYPIS